MTPPASGSSIMDTGSRTPNLPMWTSVQQPPVPGTPQAPAGYRGPSAEFMRNAHKLTEKQEQLLPGVVREVSEWPTYASDFGAFAPSQDNMVGWLKLIDTWDTEVAESKRWHAYADEQRHRVLEVFFGQVYPKFEKPLMLALESNPDVKAAFKDTAAFAKARSEASMRAAATRKEHKKAAEADDKAAKKDEKSDKTPEK